MSPDLTEINILLVDDEPKNLVALASILAGEGRNLVQATSGREALRHLLRDDFAVVLLDVHMPDMDGFDTAALIRAREKSRDTPIIFLTAAIRGETHVARGYSLGAVDYILKPFDPNVLRSKVGVFVELARRTQQVKRQAEQLAETTAFLNSVLESATDYAIAALDPEGRFLTWNEGARRLYGYPAAAMVYREHLACLHPPRDAESGALQRLLDLARQVGKAEGVFEQVRANGERFNASLVVANRKDAEGTPIGFVAIAQDITGRLRAEQERLRLIEEQTARAQAEEAQKRFAFLAEASNILSSSLDTDATLQAMARLVVPTLADICLVHLVESASGTRRRVAAVHADETKQRLLDRLLEEPLQTMSGTVIEQVMTSGQPMVVPDVRQDRLGDFAASDAALDVFQDLAPCSGLVVPLHLGERVLGTLTFLSTQPTRRYREADITFVEDVAGRASLAMENARLYEEAQSAVRVRDEFLSSASHDLKTPLTVIRGQAQLLERRVLNPRLAASPERTVEMLRKITLATTKIARLVDQMLDIAQLEAGRPLRLDRQPTNLVAMVREVVAELQEAQSRQVIGVQVDADDLTGPWDSQRLERVVGNLINNAIKYSPDGGEVSVRVAREERDDGPWAVLEVSDHGVGIPADELPRVFTRFYRGRNVIGKIYGTGIGLAGARQIVEEHSGTIGVASEEGVGTVVTVRLPLVAPPEAQEELQAEPTAAG